MANDYIKLKRNKSPKGKLTPGCFNSKIENGGSIGRKGIALYSNPGGSTSIGKFNSSIGDATGVGTSGSGGTSAGATSGCCEAMNRSYMDKRQLEEARFYIARCCNISANSVLIYPDGKFHIYNIREIDAQYIKNRLMRDPLISDVFMSSGGYDFSHFNSMMLPTLKQNISGQYTLDNDLLSEDVTSGESRGIGSALLGHAKGAIANAYDNLKLEDVVARMLIKQLKNRKPTLFIFDGKGYYTTNRLEEWIEKVASKNHHIYDAYDIFPANSTFNPSAKFEERISLYINSTTLLNSLKDNLNNGSAYLKLLNFYAGLIIQASKYGSKVLDGWIATHTKDPKELVILRFIAEDYCRKLQNGIATSLLQNFSKKILNNNLDNTSMYTELYALSHPEKSNSPKATNGDEVNPKILEDIKYHRLFSIIVNLKLYDDLTTKIPLILEQCTIIDLNYDLSKELEKWQGKNSADADDNSIDSDTSNAKENNNSSFNNRSNDIQKSDTNNTLGKGRLGQKNSVYANRAASNTKSVGNGVRGVGHKNNLYSSFIDPVEGQTLIESSIDRF